MSNRTMLQMLSYNSSLGEASIAEAIARLEQVEFEGKDDVMVLLKSGLSIATPNEHELAEAASSCNVSDATEFPYITYRVPPVVLAHMQKAIKNAEGALAENPHDGTDLEGLKTLMARICDKDGTREAIRQAYRELDNWTLEIISDVVINWARQL